MQMQINFRTTRNPPPQKYLPIGSVIKFFLSFRSQIFLDEKNGGKTIFFMNFGGKPSGQ